MNKFFSKSITSGLAFAGMAGAFLASVEPAEARAMTCHARAQACERRCAASNSNYVPCIVRTCNRQYDNCTAGGGRRGFVANTKPPGPVASGPQTPRGTDKTGPFNPGNQGPFGKTGPFIPGGMKPTGGAVPGGMPKNGGIAPRGAMFRSAQGSR